MNVRRRLAGALVAVACLGGLAACGDSPEDLAREDGEQLGKAVGKLYEANNTQAYRDALVDVREARQALAADTAELVRDEVGDQGDELADVVEVLTQAEASGDEAAFDEAREQLRLQIGDLRQQAEAFQAQDDAVANEFWRGVVDGFSDET